MEVLHVNDLKTGLMGEGQSRCSKLPTKSVITYVSKSC